MAQSTIPTDDILYDRVQKLKLIRRGYQTEKVNFTTQYDTLSEYYYQIKSEYQTDINQVTQGQYLNDGSINDNAGAKAAKLMASSLMGMVWKNEKGTFRIIPPKAIEQSKEVKEYYSHITEVITTAMERPQSRFTLSLYKTILESVIYGTSGIYVKEGVYDTPLKYHSKSILSFYIGYNKEQEISELFIDYVLSAYELYDKYQEKAGNQVLEAIRNNNYLQRFVVTEAIRPRSLSQRKSKLGKLAMPFSSDIFMPNDNIYLEEGGYESLPLKVLFYDKLEYESYGRSPGMDALPTVTQLNVAAEILAVGGELTAIPALGMYDNGSLAGLAVDASSGALNVFNVAGTVPTEKPIFPLYEVGDLRVMYEWYSALKEEVASYFLLDKLYDLNAKQRMTLGEAVMRDQIRSDSLSPIFTQIMSFLTESINRSVDIMYGKGLLGVIDPTNITDPKVSALLQNGITPFPIPEQVLQFQMNGLNWYDIQYISPAARIMNNEELNSTLKFISVMGEAGGISPDFLDVIDPDATAQKIKELTSTDSVVLRPLKDRIAIRQAREQMQMQMAQVEIEAKMAAANQANGQAAAAKSGAMRNMTEMSMGSPQQQ